MQDIAVAIVTVDRTPRENYLARTLLNMRRAGVFASKRLHSVHVADSGGHEGWPDRAITEAQLEIRESGQAVAAPLGVRGAGGVQALGPAEDLGAAPSAGAPAGTVWVHRTPHRRPSCANGAAALDAAVDTGAEWVLFCEDDIDVCGDFLESVGNWLDTYMAGYYVGVFGANYPHVAVAAARLEFVWEYPLGLFYGSQCIALRHADAALLADYWRTCPEVKGGTDMAIDLMVADWHRIAHPDQPHLLASAPSFVQHIGRVSYATVKEVTHQFQTWPGPFWVFEPGVVRI
jgi:hypothetical protein